MSLVRKLRKQRNKNKKAVVKKDKGKTKKAGTTVVTTYKKDCHTDPFEVYKNLWIGSGYVEVDLFNKCDVIVPLNNLDGSVWTEGFRGQIFYVPITDYKALPDDVLTEKAHEVVELLNKGKSVGIFCVGGHGRTGYFASAVIWILGIPQAYDTDPIGFLRSAYCEKAVESEAQMKSLADFTGIEGLEKKYETKDVCYTAKSYSWGNGLYDDFYQSPFSNTKASFVSTYNDKYDKYGDLAQYGIRRVKSKGAFMQGDADHDSPCLDCINCDEFFEKNVLKHECFEGRETGTQCDKFFPIEYMMCDDPLLT